MSSTSIQEIENQVNEICRPHSIRCQILSVEGKEYGYLIELYGSFPGWDIIRKLVAEITKNVKGVSRVMWRIDKEDI